MEILDTKKYISEKLTIKPISKSQLAKYGRGVIGFHQNPRTNLRIWL